jgi:uncharacterized protein YjdB
MKRRITASLRLATLLLVAAVSFGGCGQSNTLTSITVAPAEQAIAKGSSMQLVVSAIFGGGALTVPAWTRVTWSTSDPAVAIVGSTGIVTALSAGTAVITATDKGHPDIAASATIYVTELLSIDLSPSSAVLSAGTGTQFTATGTYSASTPTAWSATWPPDLTTLVSWVSSSTDIAVVSMETGSQGFATAVSAGTTTITATDLATGITGTAVLTVTP